MKKKKIYTIFIPIALLFICTIIVVYEMTRHGSDSNKNNDNAQPINLKDIREENNSNKEKTEDENIQKSTNNNAIVNENKTTTKENNITTKSSAGQQEQNNNKIDNDVVSKDNNTKSNTSTIWQKKYSCKNGYTLSYNSCYKTYSPTIKYFCDYGEVNGPICSYDTSVQANIIYSCKDGYTLDGMYCKKKYIIATYVVDKSLNETSKISAYNAFLNNCSQNNGTIDSNKCYGYEIVYASRKYNCDGKTGTLAGNMCVSVTTKEAYKTYDCPDGGFLTSDYLCKITEKAIENE
jgi:hypothetical protein